MSIVYSRIPKPKGRKYDFEDNFLMFNHAQNYQASKVFQMPSNGGKLNYSCHLGFLINWDNVVAAVHTHPLLDDRSVDRLNKYLSGGKAKKWQLRG